MGVIAIFLAFGVVLVNGFTDAPSSIATAACTGAIKLKAACAICAVFNFFGAITSFIFCPGVADFVLSIGTEAQHMELAGCAVMLTVIAFGIGCWIFSLPSSESHALICALVGALLADVSRANDAKKVGYVFVFMLISNALALLVSYLVCKAARLKLPYGRLQIFSCMLSSFMHGWQDGLKLISLISLLVCGADATPLYLALAVCSVLALGSLLGGKRIIGTLGHDIVELNDKSAFCSDIGSYLTLFAFSLFGVPLSTGNVKAFAIAGAGLGDKKRVNKKAISKLFVCSVITFPICYILGYGIMKLLLLF